MITTVYDPDPRRQPLFTFEHPLLLDWLTANGISPKDVPLGQPVYVLDAPEGGRVIAYTAFVRDDEGILAHGDEPVTEPRTAPYAVALPGTGPVTDDLADPPGSWWWLSWPTTLGLTVASVLLVLLAAWLS